jgi:magnesium-transporting ATPase (P-type)
MNTTFGGMNRGPKK